MVIDKERDYQDNLNKGPNGRTDGQTKQVGCFLSLMHHALNDAHKQYYEQQGDTHALHMVRKQYYEQQGDTHALHMVRKIAALAVQCLEIHGAPPR
jgi:hypothetical protein